MALTQDNHVIRVIGSIRRECLAFSVRILPGRLRGNENLLYTERRGPCRRNFSP